MYPAVVFSVLWQCITIDAQCIKIDMDHIAIYAGCATIDPYIWFNLFTVKEFDEEIDGEIHHRYHLLTTVARCTEPDYNQDAEQPEMFSDGDDESLTRAWPDQDIPR